MARARKVGAVPSKKEVEEHNLDHAVFRSWCPHCAKARVEACGHKMRGEDAGDAPTASLDYTHTNRGHEKEEEKGMPMVVVRDNKTKTIVAKEVPNEGVHEYAVEVV